MTLAPCTTHGSTYRALHEQNFRGVVEVIEQILLTVSGVGTTSYSKCAAGYPWNFEGVVRALEDLNTSISGITSNDYVLGGSGIYITTSGSYILINNINPQFVAGSGVFFTDLGNGQSSINASLSGISYYAGSGLYLAPGNEFNVNYDSVFQNSVSGHIFGEGTNSVSYSGNTVTVSGRVEELTKSYTAGESLILGDIVYVSGVSVFKATALSGVDTTRYNPIGAVTISGSTGQTVTVNSDNIVSFTSNNITAESNLVAGELYYLSKYPGQITRYSTASGIVALSGNNQYGSLVYVGRALSSTQLEVEIQPKIILTE